MAAPLEGRTILVTGSGRGIGSEVAKLAGSLGANVIVNDPGVNVDGTGHDDGPAATIAKEITDAGGVAAANFDTVATEAGGENMIKQAVDAYGRIDGVIHVAGILRDRMIFNMTEEEWDDVIAVHLTGYFNVAKPASVLMRQQRHGRIVGFSSGSGLRGNTGQGNYAAAKAGIAGASRCLARDLGRYGVTANAIAPGALDAYDGHGAGRLARAARAGRHRGRRPPGERRQRAARAEVRGADGGLPDDRSSLGRERQGLQRERRTGVRLPRGGVVPRDSQAGSLDHRGTARPRSQRPARRPCATRPRRRTTWTSPAARSPRWRPRSTLACVERQSGHRAVAALLLSAGVLFAHVVPSARATHLVA